MKIGEVVRITKSKIEIQYISNDVEDNILLLTINLFPNIRKKVIGI